MNQPTAPVSPTLDEAQIVEAIVNQARSADLWIRCWEEHRDVGGIRSAAFAIGKIAGMYNLLLQLNGGERDIPAQIIELVEKYNTIWANLTVKEN